MNMELPPLDGLRVIDMTEALAGPYCGMILGDLGADVIKVERRSVGDQSRGWGPPFAEGESAYYLSVNRNKRSVELDIKQEADLSVLHRLLDGADVFVTNNPRMESLRRCGLDPDTVRGRNPRLVYSAISGFGHSGPKAGQAGYDLLAQGEAGLMAITGDPDGGPVRFPTAMADITAGIYSLIGILAALYARDRDAGGSGEGQFLDVALLDSQLTWLANIGSSYFVTGERPRRLGNVHPTITPYQPMRARDKSILVAVGSERLWERFCAVLGLNDEVRTDARFATNSVRNENRDELITVLENVLSSRDAASWLADLVQAGIPAGPVNFPDEVLADPHTIARGMIVELEHPLIGIVRSIGNPIHSSAAGPTYRRYPPRLGEHNEEIRAELET
ncbi:MAG: CoA transferase [Gemmatimonadota bacterium]